MPAKKLDKIYEKADAAYYDGDLDKAAALYGEVLEADPLHQAALHSMGIVHYDQDDYGPAIDYMLKALDQDPTDQYVHSNLGKSLYGLHYMGEPKRAVKIAKKWAADYPDNEIAQHMAAAVIGAGGKRGPRPPPMRANDAYVAQTFDEFADSFDSKLAELKYRAPELIAKALSKAAPNLSDLRIMDAGCGTGLCAPFLAPMAARLEGVDLSAEMIAKARDRKLYAKLTKGELSAVLDKRPRRYDLVVAADVLCYFGHLETVFASFYGTLKSDGLLAFSLEIDDSAELEAPYELHVSGRYVHRRDYVDECLAGAGFTRLSSAKKTLRTEYGEPVKGVVVVARKPD
ncbi:MAG: methyltransferase domain-containing protein [Alphaproteobacteria bacterium]|nr:methyltransferase domain-containing protein [Alphaproteobacteria bacterium]